MTMPDYRVRLKPKCRCVWQLKMLACSNRKLQRERRVIILFFFFVGSPSRVIFLFLLFSDIFPCCPQSVTLTTGFQYMASMRQSIQDRSRQSSVS